MSPEHAKELEDSSKEPSFGFEIEEYDPDPNVLAKLSRETEQPSLKVDYYSTEEAQIL